MQNNYDINRFVIKQQEMYEIAYEELKKGKKRSHWMWFIFPQIDGLGSSPISKYYAIKNRDEVIEYFNNEYLKNNYLSLCEVLLKLDVCDPVNVFGFVDSLKLHSSLTLFYLITNNEIIYKVLQKFYNGETDKTTSSIIGKLNL
jgi:uncharacterized protein (DUF1810 family)